MRAFARWFGGLMMFVGGLFILGGIATLPFLGKGGVEPLEVGLAFFSGACALLVGYILYRWGGGQIFEEIWSYLDRGL